MINVLLSPASWKSHGLGSTNIGRHICTSTDTLTQPSLTLMMNFYMFHWIWTNPSEKWYYMDHYLFRPIYSYLGNIGRPADKLDKCQEDCGACQNLQAACTIQRKSWPSSHLHALCWSHHPDRRHAYQRRLCIALRKTHLADVSVSQRGSNGVIRTWSVASCQAWAHATGMLRWKRMLFHIQSY